MKNTSTQKVGITFGLVVYNEEHLIRRCLESIAPVADEIIIIHDGPCDDKTLDIAKKYTKRVYVGERLGGSDPHRIDILEQSSYDWVFMIDADEYLSEGLCDFLSKKDVLEKYNEYAGIAFHWPLWNGDRYVTKHNWRTTLFQKSKCWAIGLHNFSIQTEGDVYKANYILEHKPVESKIGFARLCSEQLRMRAARDAGRFLLEFDGLKKYNEHLIPPSFRRYLGSFLRHPYHYVLVNPLKHFLGSLKQSIYDGWYGFLSSVQLGVYQFFLIREIIKQKKEKNRRD